MSPKQNREIPPLDHQRVYQLKNDFPNLEIILNGGVETLEQVELHLQHIDGVMIGRSAYYNPWMLADADLRIYNDSNIERDIALSELEVIEQMLPYIEQQLSTGIKLSAVSRHLLGLFSGQPGARQFRRSISEGAHVPGAGIEVIEKAISHLKPNTKAA